MTPKYNVRAVSINKCLNVQEKTSILMAVFILG